MWIDYNPNPVGRRKVEDCSVRALAKALGIDWEDAHINSILKDDSDGYSYSYADEGYSGRRDSRGRYASHDGQDSYAMERLEHYAMNGSEQERRIASRMLDELRRG